MTITSAPDFVAAHPTEPVLSNLAFLRSSDRLEVRVGNATAQLRSRLPANGFQLLSVSSDAEALGCVVTANVDPFGISARENEFEILREVVISVAAEFGLFTFWYSRPTIGGTFLYSIGFREREG